MAHTAQHSVLRPLPARAGSGLLQYNLTNDKASSPARQLPCDTREWPGAYKNITLTKTKCHEASSLGPSRAWGGGFMVHIVYVAQSTEKEHNEASSPGPGRPGEEASWRILETPQQNEKA